MVLPFLTVFVLARTRRFSFPGMRMRTLRRNSRSASRTRYVRDDIVSLERMVKPRGTPEHDFLDLMKRLLE